MAMWAKPGVKCVCVAVFPAHGPYAHKRPVIDQIYTVAGSEWGDISLGEIGAGIFWDPDQFRPLITRTQSEDVALFRKLLETAGADA